MDKRKGLALVIAVLVAIIYVGTFGLLPNFGEVSVIAFATALLGLWMVGSLCFGRRR